MNHECCNKTISENLNYFEFGLLSGSEKERFEEHLLECDACFQSVYETLPAMQTIAAFKSEFLAAATVAPSVLEQGQQRFIDFIETLIAGARFEESLFSIFKPAMVVAAIALVAVLLISPEIIFQSDSTGNRNQLVVEDTISDNKISGSVPQDANATLREMESQSGKKTLRLHFEKQSQTLTVQWFNRTGIEHYNVFLVTGDEQQQLTPEGGIRDTTFVIPYAKFSENQSYSIRITAFVNDVELMIYSQDFTF